MTLSNLTAPNVDIAFILEGSYPYTSGGVSTWVHQLIECSPQYTFAIIFLGGSPEQYKDGICYKLPKNVIHFQTHFLYAMDNPKCPVVTPRSNPEVANQILKLHDHYRDCHSTRDTIKDNIADCLRGPHAFTVEQFLYGINAWSMIQNMYNKYCPNESFIDYFWTLRNTHKPLWKLIDIVEQFPKAKVIHTPSTGFAGLLSYFIHQKIKIPVILTEHGIYTRERRIDIFLSKMFRINFDLNQSITDISYLRQFWDRFFKTLAKLCYDIADPIISLFRDAQHVQHEEGADPNKTIVIPNGVDIQRFQAMRRPLDQRKNVICFLGRIVPIKDVKGFIKAVPNIMTRINNLDIWIVGATDQAEDYAEECLQLAQNIGIESAIQFKPHQSIDTIFPEIKIIVLTSIREGMPFTVLESFAAGVPVIATDVGSCKELILGGTEEDIALGPAGIVINVADPKALENAIVTLLSDPELWEQMSKAAIQRAERYYDQNVIIARYHQLYQEKIDLWQG